MQFFDVSSFIQAPGTGIGLEPNTIPPPSGPNPLPGVYNLIVTATTPGVGSGQGAVTINILQAATPVIYFAGPFNFATPVSSGALVGQVLAINVPTVWTILSGDPLGNFQISNTGIITTKQAVTTSGTETLQVQASNSAGASQALVTITWVAGAPVVQPATFNIAVPVTLNETIGQMTATGGVPTSWLIVGGNYDNYYAINNSGLITAAQAAVTSTTNLILQSQNFGTTWSLTGLGPGSPFGTETITSGATVAPDGTTTGELLGEDTTTNFHRISQQVTKAATATTYTLSVYAKAQNRPRIELQLDDNAANGVYATYDLTTGAVLTPVGFGTAFTSVTASSQSVAGTNGWYRCILTATSNTATALDVTIANDGGTSTSPTAVQSYAGAGPTTGSYIWGAQLEASGTVGPYIPTTTASASQTGLPVGTYTLAIQATNAVGSSQANATIVATAPPIVNNATFSPALPLSANEVVGTMTAVNGATSWAITAGNTAGDWQINNSGAVSVTASGASAITTPTNFSLTVQATNAAGSGSGTCAIDVGAAQPPVVTGTTFNITTQFPQGGVVGTVSATNNPTAWAITAGDTAGDFQISGSGVITSTKVITGTSSESLTVRATNSAGSGSATVVVNWTSGAPVVTAATFNILTPFTVGGTIGTVTATNSPTSFAISSGDTGSFFSISNTGVLSAAQTIPAGTSSESLTITATNSFGSGNAIITVSWTPGAPVVSNQTFTPAT